MSNAYGILYAEDFDEPEVVPDLPPPVFTQAERDRAVAEACAAAIASAQADWGHLDQQRRTAALTALSDAFAGLQAEILRQQVIIAGETAKTILTIVAAMLPSLSAQHGPAEVSALLKVVLPRLTGVLRVTVTVAPGTVQLVRPDLALFDDPVASALTLVPDATLAPGDVGLKWPNGSLVRGTAAIAAEVLAAVQAMLPGDAFTPEVTISAEPYAAEAPPLLPGAATAAKPFAPVPPDNQPCPVPALAQVSARAPIPVYALTR